MTFAYTSFFYIFVRSKGRICMAPINIVNKSRLGENIRINFKLFINENLGMY